MSDLTPQIGLSTEAMEACVDILQKLLADEYVLYTKLRKYHWNVVGPQFKSLHELFEEQYTMLETKIDNVAERTRTYGVVAIGTLEEFKEHSRLQESPGKNPEAKQMIADIMADHEAMVRQLREDIDTVDDDIEDDGLEDFLIATMQDHQDMAWMLRAYLQGM